MFAVSESSTEERSLFGRDNLSEGYLGSPVR